MYQRQINLSNLTDKQKTYLTQLAYLDINNFGARKAKMMGVRVGDLKSFLSNPDLPFCGTAVVNKDSFDKIASMSLGDYKMPTDVELLNDIINLDLGGVIITDVQSDTRSGFQATAFKDSFGNTGISFRGSDFDFSRGGISDWIEADLLEYFTNDSTQRRQAIEFFNDHKSFAGANYLYEHSLGGNLASHVYAEFHNEIKEVFLVNGYPINQKILDTQAKIDAFNSPQYISNSICGDIVSHLKDCEMYQDNVRWIKNNRQLKASVWSAHLVQSASYDENGIFVEIQREEMFLRMDKASREFTNATKALRNNLNALEDQVQQSMMRGQEAFEKYKNEFGDWIGPNLDQIAQNIKLQINSMQSKSSKLIDRGLTSNNPDKTISLEFDEIEMDELER